MLRFLPVHNHVSHVFHKHVSQFFFEVRSRFNTRVGNIFLPLSQKLTCLGGWTRDHKKSYTCVVTTRLHCLILLHAVFLKRSWPNAGSRLRYLTGVVVRVCGVRVMLSGSRLRYLAGGCAGLRVCGCAGLRVLGCAIWLVWLCGCAGFGQRYLVRVVNKLAGGCGCAGTSWF